MATPRESGTAITSAMSEETSVPKMSGKAPNCSATGSQVLVVTKPNPNLAIASRDPVHSSYTRNASNTGIVTAPSVRMNLNTRSP